MVASPLVETKLFIPQPRRDSVARPRLIDLLDRDPRARPLWSPRQPASGRPRCSPDGSAHLIINTRVDPALPLVRLRARRDLVEIRAADLRLTRPEVAAYLNEVAALNLTADDIEALEARTEGWIAALQLAALSLRGRADATAFIDAFAGDDRYIVDYLVEEVLSRQPSPVRDFLLQTSILDRLSLDPPS